MEEIEAERGVVIDALQTIFGAVCDLANRVSTQVCQLLGFHIAPDLLNRIEFWGVPWQPLDAKPVPLIGQPFRHASTAMGRQSIPDQQDQSVLLMPMEFLEKLDEAFGVVGARKRLKDEVGIASVGLVEAHRGSPVVLVPDNCEHVVQACAALAVERSIGVTAC